MAATYYAQILARWDWPRIVEMTKTDAASHGPDPEPESKYREYPDCLEGCDDDGHVGTAYLGSVMNNAPSGKFYMPWTTNQTADDVDRDSRWFEALDKVADKFGGWVESGEGDPTDMFFCRYWPRQEQVTPSSIDRTSFGLN